MQRAKQGIGVQILIADKVEEAYANIYHLVVGAATVVEKRELTPSSMYRKITKR